MTNRDRLIELIGNLPFSSEYEKYNSSEWVERFADHLLANGVIVPPCKVGDKVYTYGARRVKEWKITFVGKNSRGEHKIIAADDEFKNMLEFWDYDIGKTVFLTKEEAEQALATDTNVGSKKEREGK